VDHRHTDRLFPQRGAGDWHECPHLTSFNLTRVITKQCHVRKAMIKSIWNASQIWLRYVEIFHEFLAHSAVVQFKDEQFNCIYNSVIYGSVARQLPRNKTLYNSRS
jgi:hypothetical protein